MSINAQVENLTKVGNRTYICWTQAGFKKACSLMKDDDRDEVENYPKSYPSLVQFTSHYRGYDFWYASCTPLSTEIENARLYHQKLVDADAEHHAQLEASK